jgi:4-hydroxythreonine-4-phosphate dehydrogenase
MRPLAVSVGDPAGVGPELLGAAWERRGELPAFLVCGGARLLAAAGASVVEIADPAEAADAFAHGVPVLAGADGDYRPGAPDAQGAALALASLARAAELALAGQAGGIVTGPVSKALIAPHAPDFVGQTEFCADACGFSRRDAVMLLAGPQLKVVPLTVHCALADVPRLITRELILHRTRIAARAMRDDFGIAAPRIAMTGLNPHAGESGRMGREEIEVIAPAIAELQAEGMDVTGPHPADTLFAPHLRPTYDVAIAMYHDQALAPLKALDFDQGVNMTLGLPIVRTSPDHGTAFGIAGKGLAHPGALLAAIRMAGEVAGRRAITRTRSS